MLLRRVGHQAEHRQPDEKSIRLRARAQAERRCDRVALWLGQSSAAVQQSCAKLMQAGERKLHLPFHPDRPKDPTALRALGRVLQQGRFAYSRLTAEHQHTALPQPGVGQQLIKPRTLGRAAG